MDRITTNLLNTFCTESGISTSPESDAFEHFANYCVIAHEYSDTFNVADISTGKATGIDGIAIIVNGSLITSEEEIADLCKANKFLDVAFIFVQSKTSSSFDGGEIGTYFFAVKDFFSENPELPQNENIKRARQIFDAILEQSSLFTKGKPACRLYYVTTGKWVGEEKLSARVNSEVADIEGLRLFRSVTFKPIGADELQELYSNTKSKISTEFNFPQKALLPPILGVSEAYIGVVSASEYIKLISDDAGNIRKSLFTDNVRDFQDYNEVNEEIRGTLRSASPDRFAILNNGVTIVAKSLSTVRDAVRIEDYQIVNGCQTSHIIYDERSSLTDNVFITVKVICTEDDDLMNSVVKATNNQTQVTAEQLAALSDFQKKLEAYYQTFTEADQRLHYERRSRQFATISGVEKVRIVTIPLQIKSFASMFLNLPHKAGRYYGTLLTDNLRSIFLPNHHSIPYYTSAYGMYKLESLFRRGQQTTGAGLDYSYRKFRDPLLMLARILVAGADIPDLGSHKIEAYCQQILDVLWSDEKALAVFGRATQIIDSLGGTALDRSVVKTATFTNDVLKKGRELQVKA